MANKLFDYGFIAFGILLQLVVYFFTKDSLLSLASGLCGVVSVVLCSQRKITFYWFGFIQLITYVILCWHQRLYAEIAENAFYAITMLYGLYHWKDNYNHEEKQVKTRKLKPIQAKLMFISTAALSMLLFAILLITDDTQPLMDAITTVPAFVAQILMILRFKESWHYWLIIDVGSVLMWSIAGDWCMASQFLFWTINCLYGLKKWNNYD